MYSNNKNILFFLFSVLIFVTLYYFDFLSSNLMLADDYAWQLNFKSNEIKLYDFLNTIQFSPRPISSLLYYYMMLNFYNNVPILHLINLFFFLFSLFLLGFIFYKKNIFNKEYFFLLFLVILYFPFSPSTLFCPIMVNSNIAIIFFLLSLIILCFSNNYNTFFSGLLFTFSILSYEVCVPFIIINIVFIINTYSKNLDYKKLMFKILFFIIPILILAFYKKFIEEDLFTNHFIRAILPKSFFDKITGFSLSLFKLLLLDYFIFLKKSINGIFHYTLIDFLTLFFGILATIFSFKLYSKNLPKKNIPLILSIIFLALTFIIFIFSNNKLTSSDFDNRTLGVYRFTFSIFILSIFSNLIRFYKFFKYFAFIFVISLLIINIQVKKSWQYASKLTVITENNLNRVIPKKFKNNIILLSSSINKPEFNVSCPPFFGIDYYSDVLVGKIAPNNIGGTLIKNDYFDSFLGKELNTYASNWSIKDNQLFINSKKYKFPFYIFVNNQKSLKRIKNLSQFKSFIFENK